MSNEIEVIEAEPAMVPAAPSNPMDMISHAVMNGADVSVIQRLMDLEERWAKTQGRREFDQAIAAAKAEIPVIIKNRKSHTGKYADFAAYSSTVSPILSRYGLSFRFRTTQENGVAVTCILSHSSGHSEESTLKAPEDKSGSKNAVQAIGSTVTYLQRYTLVMSLGLAASEDDDANMGSGSVVSEHQFALLDAKVKETGADEEKFLAFMKVASLSEMPASRFREAMQLLDRAKNRRN